MVLSGVARTEARVPCGKTVIAQMLCGSSSAKMTKLRMNKLSTFGLLWQLKQTEVVTLIDLLIANGCLEQEDIDRFRPVLRLTPLGADVMRGKTEMPPGLNLPRDLRQKLLRPVAKEPTQPRPQVAGGSETAKTAEEARSVSRAQREDVSRESATHEERLHEDAWIASLGLPEYDEAGEADEAGVATDVSIADAEPPSAGWASESVPPATKMPSTLGAIEEIADFLASGPSPEEMLQFRPSPALQSRAEELLVKSRDGELSREERAELGQFEQVEHLMRFVKARIRAGKAGRS